MGNAISNIQLFTGYLNMDPGTKCIYYLDETNAEQPIVQVAPTVVSQWRNHTVASPNDWSRRNDTNSVLKSVDSFLLLTVLQILHF